MSEIKTQTKLPTWFINATQGYIKNASLITAIGMLVGSTSMAVPSKGIVYVGLTILAVFVRIGFLMLTSYSPGPEVESIDCRGDLPDELQYYDGGRNNLFMLSFTLLYITLPMLLEKDTKWPLVMLLTVQLALSCLLLYGKQCVTNMTAIMCEIIGGALYGSIVSVTMYFSGLKNLLMLSGIPSEEEVKKSVQKLKCVVKKIA